ncbi:hypothetical protein LTR39_001880 [Cryomyces antarcticus]|nr:hypothetical protein LTR39_001880 [Cryomyces antarcticus]
MSSFQVSNFGRYSPLSVESRQIRLLTLLPSSNKFPVTHNLHATLRALRNNRTKRVLWVDALCINQADIPERIAQVAQMRHIYEAAQEVAVWLGGETSGSPRAFSFLKTFAASGCWTTRAIQGMVGVNLHCMFGRAEKIMAGACIVTIPAVLDAHMDLPRDHNFTTVAFAIHSYEDLLRAIEPVLNSPRVLGVYHASYNAALARSQRQTLGLMGTPMLLDALCTQRSSNATDPKDKVYSLLGVVKNHFLGLPELPTGPGVVIDYSLSVAEIYNGVVRHIVKKTGSLDVLCACQNPERVNAIPTWAPDWSTKRTNGPIKNPDQWGHIHFACRSASIAWWLEPPDDDTLVVNGVYMDTIEEVGAVHTYGWDWEELKENWKNLPGNSLP